MYRMSIMLYAPGDGGVFSEDTPLPDINTRVSSYQHAISATLGFESMSATFPGTLADAIFWSAQLMAGIVVYGSDGVIAWEGYLGRVEINLGQRQRAIGLDRMANRVKTRYTTVNGVSGVTVGANDVVSLARYGAKDHVLALPTTTSTGAAQYEEAYLSAHAFPVMEPTTRLETGAGSAVTITLIGAGWGTTLDWVVTSSSTTSTAVTTAQVATLLSDYNAVNAFLNDATRITASGISDTQYIQVDTTYRAAIERLLVQGNGVARYAWGVYEERMFWAQPWAGATPDTITYRGRFGSQARVYGTNGNLVMPWSVRPDTMYEEVDLLDIASLSAYADAAARHYVERVSFTLTPDAYSVDMEPAETDDLTARLARFSG
jgi:hypothetical protein